MESSNINKVNPPSSCPVCGSVNIFPFLKINQLPVHCHTTSKTKTASRMIPKGDIHLASCAQCGHIFNKTYNSELLDYSSAYENSLHFSPTFQNYATWQADRLINRYSLFNKELIEIGSGPGDFIYLLCSRGNNRGVGFDPSYYSQPDPIFPKNQIDFIPGYFNEKYYDYPVDLICSRHTLEHVPDPRAFIQNIRRALDNKPEAVVFIEVPNASFIFEHLSIWDIIYEHYSYFSRSSLTYLMEENGFIVHNIDEPFNGQFLTIEATIASGSKTKNKSLTSRHQLRTTDILVNFATKFKEKVSRSRSHIDKLVAKGSRVVGWGAGSKAVSYLNLVAHPSQIDYVVDVNPRKIGLYISGSGQEIVPPEFLRTYCPDHVIVMNSIYQQEIRQSIEEIGLHVDYSYP